MGCFGSGQYAPICDYCISSVKCREVHELDQIQKAYHTPKWFKVKESVIKRDKYQCVLCESKTNLQAHHKIRARESMDWFYSENNCITLCQKCHLDLHKEAQKEGQEIYNYWREASPYSTENPSGFFEGWAECIDCRAPIDQKYKRCKSCYDDYKARRGLY